MKRILSILLAAVMIFMFAGCGNGDVIKIGVTQFADHPSLDNCREGFIKGLEEMGYKDKSNIEIEFKSAQADMSMAIQIAQNFANNNMDLVCGIATPSAQTLYSYCNERNIPVLFNAVSDPVEAKLAVSSKEPMKGITGVSDELPVESQLKLIRKLMPDAKKIGILYTVSEANSVSTIRKYKELAPKYNFEIIEKGVTKQAEVAQATDVLLNEVDVLSNMTDNTVVAVLATIVEKAKAKNIPVFGSEEEQVKNGCVASAGLDYVELGRLAGKMAGRILKGEDINTIPYEKMTEDKITINENAVKEFNIKVPDDILNKAEKI